jgi:hypothetical protein
MVKTILTLLIGGGLLLGATLTRLGITRSGPAVEEFRRDLRTGGGRAHLGGGARSGK